MFRIDTSRKALARPTPLPQGTPGYFQDTNPAGGTEVSADWLNAVQEEIAHVIEALGHTLDKTDVTQLWAALEAPLTILGSFKDQVRIGDPDGTGIFSTIIGTEGGVLGPLFGYVETDKAYLEEGLFIGTQASSTQAITADRDCAFRNITLSSGGVDGIKAIASTGRLATIGPVYAQGDIKAGCTDLNGAGAKFTVNGGTGNINTKGDIVVNQGGVGGNDALTLDSATGNMSAAGFIGAYGDLVAGGKVSGTGGLAVGYLDNVTNTDPATMNSPSGKVSEWWVGSSVWSSGVIQTQTINCDKVGANSIVLVSVQAGDGSPATYRPISCGVREQAVGSFVIWARNDGTDMTDPTIAWRFVVINPV